MVPPSLLLLKFGGSLITDKHTPNTARRDIIRQLATDFATVYNKHSNRRYILGNGAGSFGHYAALHHDVTTPDGFARIHEKVRELNELFRVELDRAGVPVTVFTGAEILQLQNGDPTKINLTAIQSLLKNGTVPMVYGDVIPDTVRGGAIYSTEMLFEIIARNLCGEFSQTTILHLTTVAGFLDRSQHVIPVVTRGNFAELMDHLAPTAGFDVTGGMRHKIEQSLQLADLGITTQIVDGSIPGICQKIILAKEPLGTTIS